MNPTLALILSRKSVRSYELREIEPDVKGQILSATLRAPTAGNLMLYSIIEVKDQKTKDKLAITCDNQPFIAKAPLVLLFLADYQRWYDYYKVSGVDELCNQMGTLMRKPGEGDLFLACCDALIAAQTAVVAAESLGIGSCYIGDIMENYEEHQTLFDLPRYVFPICLLCFGYPTQQQKDREMTSRFDQRYIVFEDRYHLLERDEFEAMFHERQQQVFGKRTEVNGLKNIGQVTYMKKFGSDFAREMNRSVGLMLQNWTEK